MSIKKALLSFILSATLVLPALSIQSFAESMPITWNPAEKGSSVTLSNELMTARCDYNAAESSVRAFPSNNGKKVYWEMTIDDENGTSCASLGIQYIDGSFKTVYYPESASDYYSTLALDNPSRFPANATHYDDIKKGDTVSFALNMEIGELKIFRNNQLIKTYPNINTTKTVVAMTGQTNGASWHVVTANFGMKPFKYAIPEGYKPYDALSPLNQPVVVEPNNPADNSTTTKAIIEITLNNGKIKEYEVTAAELAKYQDWFDKASEGTGKKYYTFVKTVLVKPFTTRKETIQFKDIETFEVKEY